MPERRGQEFARVSPSDPRIGRAEELPETGGQRGGRSEQGVGARAVAAQMGEQLDPQVQGHDGEGEVTSGDDRL